MSLSLDTTLDVKRSHECRSPETCSAWWAGFRGWRGRSWASGAASVGTGWEPAQEALGNDSSRVSESTELFERDVSDMMRADMIRVL